MCLYMKQNMPVIDTHCHILPCIDDGSKSVDESLEMLHMMGAEGTGVAVATPHFYAKHKDIGRFLEDRQKSYEALKARLDENCPDIVLGAEVAFFFDISKAKDLEKLCIEGTKTLLLELPTRTSWGDYEFSEIQNIVLNRGLDVVIAHYERYKDSQGKNPYYGNLLSLPVYIQISADEFGGLFRGKESLGLFRSGKAQLLGSDAHNTGDRAPCLGKGRKYLGSKIGQSKLDEIDELGNRLFLGK